jgi:GNAT superfamily N-acetyltransferase
MAYRLSFDLADQQIDLIHAFLSGAYWSKGIPRHIVEAAVANSFCVGMFDAENEQVAFARVITDKATFAYLADVFVLPAHRGQGLARQMLEALQAHPELQGLRRWLLFTKDAQELYASAGWAQYPNPERVMVRSDAEGFV